MAKGFGDGVVLGQIRTLFDEGAVGSLSDGELLERFLDDRGESGEAAFGALVRRHGPLVFGVCRRALRDSHQTEDAFQATFLVLARRARSIRNREAVGPWLVGVAGKVAARARGDALRRRTHEEKAAGLAPRWSSAEPADRDEVAVLLAEVDRLRRPLRDAVVLCHLQELTYASAAEALGVSEGTIRGRLARARETLRNRLDRRGISRDTSALIALRVSEVPPTPLVAPTIRGSMAVAAGRAAIGIVPSSAITLMEGALKAMWFAKLKTALLVASGVGLITLGAALRVDAWQRPEGKKSNDAAKDPTAKGVEPALADAVDGKIVRSTVVTNDCSILAYMPDWAHGNVDNLMIGNNGGGVRTLVDWSDVPPSEAKNADLKFFLAFYSRKTNSNPKPGSILAFELTSEWPELTSWKTRPGYEPEPVASAKFEPGDGWKIFDITSFVRDRDGKANHGLMLRFLSEDRDDWSGYAFVSREGQKEWAKRRPMMLVVAPEKK
jgi:RNA polymerase sigma factor (sigma-70 family)